MGALKSRVLVKSDVRARRMNLLGGKACNCNSTSLLASLEFVDDPAFGTSSGNETIALSQRCNGLPGIVPAVNVNISIDNVIAG
ncbi:hypothetical protein [Paraburkholderia silvatlantica]|uniref:hypothetical protein n=1 Tax=Paraburkholderia silvatlantica TaxID=321895 RepID=UPI0011B80DAA|nr:hypothetical protein [Paraburkholderia silvatlantica]